MKTTYRKLYKFETTDLALAWIQKTNPAEKIDIYIEEFNNFFYNDLITKSLVEQGTGTSGGSILSKEFKFITGDDLDEEQNYYLSKDNLGKFNIVYIDNSLYPNGQIRFPEGYMGTDAEVNGQTILLYFLDGGTFQKSSGSVFIKSLSMFSSINGSEDINASDSVSGDFIELTVFNDTDSEITSSLSQNLNIIYDNLSGTYKTAHKFFFDRLTTSSTITVHQVSNNDTITLVKKTLNVIFDNQKITEKVNIILPDYQTRSDYEVLFYSQINEIIYWSDNVELNNIYELARLPKFAADNERLLFKSYKLDNDNGNFLSIDTVDEKAYKLGRVLYTDVNAAAESSTILIPITTEIPIGWYIDRFVVQTLEDFIGSYSFNEGDIITISSNAILDTNKFIKGERGLRISSSVSYNAIDINDQPISDLAVRLNWIEVLNPKDYTNGSLAVTAILKRAPYLTN